MPRKKSGKNKVDSQNLKRLLHSFWLVSDMGIVAAGIDQVVKACFKRQEVVVAVQEGARGKLFTKTLSALGIRYREEMVNTYRQLRGFTHASRGLLKKVCILRVPTLADRVEDFELLLPFAYERTLRDLNSEQGQHIKAVEGGFILSVLVLLRFGGYGLLEIMKDAILRAEKGIIRGAGSPGFRVDPNAVSEFIGDVSPAAGAYLGLGKKGSHEDRTPWKAEELYPAVEMKQEFSSAIGSGEVPFTYPKLQCSVRFEPENLGLVARNFAYCYRRPEFGMVNPALYCLKLRLWGVDEQEIHNAVIHGDAAEYEAFLARNHISLASTESRDVLREWEEARDILGLSSIDIQEVVGASSADTDLGSHETGDIISREKPPKAIFRLHMMTRELSIDGKKVPLFEKKYKLFDALVLIIHELQNTGDPVQSHRIISAAKAPTGYKVYDLFKDTPIKPFLINRRYGFYSLEIDLVKSKVT